jgi:PAS domain S-box-containing protein
MSAARTALASNGRNLAASATEALSALRRADSDAHLLIRGSDIVATAELDPLIATWRETCARLDELDAIAGIGEALFEWIQIAGESLGAAAGVCELRVERGSDGLETLRTTFGLDDRVASMLAAGDARDLWGPDQRQRPSVGAVEVIDALDRDERFVGTLVGTVLETAGVRALVTLHVHRRGEFGGSLTYAFPVTDPLSFGQRWLASMLVDRLSTMLRVRGLTQRLQRNDVRLHAILEGAGDAIVTVGPDERVLDANHAASLMFGYSRDEALGLQLSEMLPNLPREAPVPWTLGLAGTQPGRQPREAIARRRDGSEFLAEVVSGSGARQHGHTLLIRDAGVRRAAELHSRQCERLACMGTLVAGLSHDLNNALLPIRAHVGALAKSRIRNDKSERERHHRAIADGLASLQALADGLHLLASEERPAVDASTDIAQWWELVGPLLSKALHGRAAIESAIAQGVARALVDEQSLTRAVLALIANAGDAMPAQRPSDLGRVVLRSYTRSAREVVVEVADNGMGMSEDVHRRAFDAYFTTKPRGIGTGLGLPIVRMIVERSGGHVELETHLGAGTLVRLVFRSTPPSDALIQSISVAVLPKDGRLATMFATLLRARGVEPEFLEDPWQSDICVAAESVVDPAMADRWMARRPAHQLIVIGVPLGAQRSALGARGVTLIDRPVQISNIEAAIRHVLGDPASEQEELQHG